MSNQMTFRDRKSRADQILEGFIKFHKNNLHVWEMYCRFADQIRSVRSFYSAHAILHRVRWEIDFTTTDEEAKINNNYSAYYARMYLATHPEAGGFFKLRRLESADRSAYKNDLTFHDTGPPIDEEILIARLKALAEQGV
jgi:hypothetical protein